MARLIEYEGYKYSIPDDFSATILTVNLEGVEVKFTSLGLHDPDLHEQQGFTTVASVLKWWFKHRETLMVEAALGFVDGWLKDKVANYFGLVPSSRLFSVGQSYDTTKEYLEGYLRQSSLTLSRGSGRGTTQFQLATIESNDDEWFKCFPITRDVARMYMEPSGDSPAEFSCDDQWLRHWNYSHRMDSEAYGWFRSANKENSVFFGMELELSTKLDCREIQYIVTEVEPKQEPFFIFKQDGSISGRYSNAYELVTVPCTPRYLRKNWKLFFQKLERLCADQGKTIGDYFDISDNLNNGLHIHVSRDSFHDRRHYNKFLTAWNQWDQSAVDLIASAANRPSDYTQNQYCHISRQHKDTIQSTSKVKLEKFERRREQRSLALRLKGIDVTDRSCVAHNNNANTVEVRVFQGIVDIGHVMRAISFTEAMFEYCIHTGYTGFDKYFASNFSDFVYKQRKFASLFSLIEKGVS